MKKSQLDPKLSASLMKLGADKRLGGLSSGSLRLSSLRPARDLSLGGAPKRTFAPNIPARRIKEEPGPSTASASTEEKRKDRRRDERPPGRGRGRGRREIVTASSIFSHGPFAGSKPGFSKTERFQPAVEKLSMKSVMGGSKSGDDITDESQKVLDMLKDEGRIESEAMDAASLMPITIPLANSKLITKKEETDDEFIPDDPMDEDEIKRVRGDKSPVKSSKDKQLLKTHAHKSMAKDTLTCAELFTQKSREDVLLFFQFPDALPVNSLTSDKGVPSSTLQDKKVTGNGSENKQLKEENIEESLKKFSFQNVSEGYIGKLQVHKSGRVRLLVGNATLDVSMGIPCGFLQDLVAVHTEGDRREMLSLGHLSHRLICTPNYDDLLGSLGDIEG